VKKEPVDETKFYNPALAAIRASQQLRQLDANGELNGNKDSVQASIQALQELAAERQRRFDDEQAGVDTIPTTAGVAVAVAVAGTGALNDSSAPESPSAAANQLKRSISEVSDVELQSSRPVPPFEPNYNTVPPVLNPALNHKFPPTPPKRRPDPNDDTIGSDLDDSEDEGDIDSEADDDDMPLMLCSYDKVNRTKNKWRANLSHGIVCINGREWVFERGNGEYEW